MVVECSFAKVEDPILLEGVAVVVVDISTGSVARVGVETMLPIEVISVFVELADVSMWYAVSGESDRCSMVELEVISLVERIAVVDVNEVDDFWKVVVGSVFDVVGRVVVDDISSVVVSKTVEHNFIHFTSYAKMNEED